MESAFANTLEGREAERCIERDCVRFRIGDDANAPKVITLIEG